MLGKITEDKEQLELFRVCNWYAYSTNLKLDISIFYNLVILILDVQYIQQSVCERQMIDR